jgi:hypothetical protein
VTQRPALTATQRRIAVTVVIGGIIIAAIGFTGSYAAVRELALHKGFGRFANVFPIGIDAGITVLLALDLLLTWLRIPFPLIRHTAWLLTAATIAFNAATAWPDPLGVGMHAVIPILFVVTVEAARHAVGRIADITADRHMDPVRLARWFLAPWPTFRLWRRMKLWELRSYDEVIRLEQQRLIYRARLRARYGRMWRWSAPVEAVTPLRLTRFGVALPAPPPATSPALAAVAGEAPHGRNVICAGTTGVLTALLPAPAPAVPRPTPPSEAPMKRPALRAAAPQQRTTPTPAATPAPEAASSASFDRHTDDALRLAGLSKAAAVRAVIEAHPAATAPQIAERLAEHGITATASSVRTVLSRERKRRRDTSGTGQYL